MNGPLFDFFTTDHRRLELLLDRATRDSGAFDMEAYAAFRSGLLRHIGMEEKILIPAAQAKLNHGLLPFAERIRLDHGALVALMVPPPSTQVVGAIRAILAVHDALEEQEGGVYDVAERLTASETDLLLRQLRSAPDVPVLPHKADPFILEATRRALQRAGYDFDRYR